MSRVTRAPRYHAPGFRVEDAARTWAELDRLTSAHRLPDRAAFALFPATLGLRVRRPVYEKDAEIEGPTAGRDLRMWLLPGY